MENTCLTVCIRKKNQTSESVTEVCFKNEIAK